MKSIAMTLLVVAMVGCGGRGDGPGVQDLGTDLGPDFSFEPFDAGGDPEPQCELGLSRLPTCSDGWVPACPPGESEGCVEGLATCIVSGRVTADRMVCRRVFGDGSVPPSCDDVLPAAPTVPTCGAELAVTCLDTVDLYAGIAWCQDDTGQRFLWEPACPYEPGGSVTCLEGRPECSLGGGVPLPDPPTCVRRGCYGGDPQPVCQL